MEGQFAVFSQGSCLWYVYGKLSGEDSNCITLHRSLRCRGILFTQYSGFQVVQSQSFYSANGAFLAVFVNFKVLVYFVQQCQ